MAAGPGRKAFPSKEPRFILACRRMKASELSSAHCLNPEPGAILERDAIGNAGTGLNVNDPLKVLIVEDSENDAALLEIELQRAGFDPLCHRVENRPQMIS